MLEAFDYFKRANQVQWGTADDGKDVWSVGRGVPIWNVLSNQGAVNTTTGSFAIFLLGSIVLSNIDERCTITPADTTANTGIVILFNDLNNFIYIVLNGGNAFLIGRDLANTFSTLASAVFSYSAGTAYNMRVLQIGSTILAKVWLGSSAEPSAWTVSATDSSFASGKFGCGTDTVVATNSTFNNFIITDTRNTVMDGTGGVF